MIEGVLLNRALFHPYFEEWRCCGKDQWLHNQLAKKGI